MPAVCGGLVRAGGAEGVAHSSGGVARSSGGVARSSEGGAVTGAQTLHCPLSEAFSQYW